MLILDTTGQALVLTPRVCGNILGRVESLTRWPAETESSKGLSVHEAGVEMAIISGQYLSTREIWIVYTRARTPSD